MTPMELEQFKEKLRKAIKDAWDSDDDFDEHERTHTIGWAEGLEMAWMFLHNDETGWSLKLLEETE